MMKKNSIKNVNDIEKKFPFALPLVLGGTTKKMIDRLLDESFMSKLTAEDKKRLEERENQALKVIKKTWEDSFQELCEKIPNYRGENFFSFVEEEKKNYPILETIYWIKENDDDKWELNINDRYSLYCQNDELENDDKSNSNAILQKKINLLEVWEKLSVYTIDLFAQEIYFSSLQKSLQLSYDQIKNILKLLTSTGLFEENNSPNLDSEKKEQIKTRVLLLVQETKKTIEKINYNDVIEDLIIEITKLINNDDFSFAEISEKKWWSWYSSPCCKGVSKLKKLASDFFYLRFINNTLKFTDNIDYVIDNIKKAIKINDIISKKLKEENKDFLSLCCNFWNKSFVDLDFFTIVDILFDSIEQRFIESTIKDFSEKDKVIIDLDLNYPKEIIFNLANTIDELWEGREIKNSLLIFPKELNNFSRDNFQTEKIKETSNSFQTIRPFQNVQNKKSKKNLLDYWWIVIPVIIMILGVTIVIKIYFINSKKSIVKNATKKRNELLKIIS